MKKQNKTQTPKTKSKVNLCPINDYDSSSEIPFEDEDIEFKVECYDKWKEDKIKFKDLDSNICRGQEIAIFMTKQKEQQRILEIIDLTFKTADLSKVNKTSIYMFKEVLKKQISEV